jgi:UDP-glucose 4-epimerase
MILIVGGAGYIGSHANKELNKRGYRTLVLDNLVYGHEEAVQWGEFVQGDLSDTDKLRDIFSTYPIKAVMHFAAYAYVGESVTDPKKYYVNNVANTLNLLNVMLEFGVKFFIFSSTCATYGNPVEIPITETHPQNPINPYGQSKLMVEQILRDYSRAYGLRYVSLRYFNAAGADADAQIGEDHDPETHLIPLVLDAALGRREDIKVFGSDYDTKDGTAVRDYIHVTDLAEAHILALKHLESGADSDVFNLGNGQGYSVKEVIDTVKAVTGRSFTVTPAERREGDPAVLIGSAEKAKAVLGWEPEFPELEAIVETAWKWHLKRHAVQPKADV